VHLELGIEMDNFSRGRHWYAVSPAER